MFNTMIGKFCSENSNYEELLSNEPYFVKTKRTTINDTDFVMFCYNQIKSDFNNPIVKECRGIIFEEGCWENPVCHAFDKFFNYGEDFVADIDWESAKVTEKIDGSLIKMWKNPDSNNYVISTNGTINAFDAPIEDYKYKSFGELFVNAIDITELLSVVRTYNKSTYMFELVSPVNRVVVPYEKLQVYFLGERDFEGRLTSFTDSECTEEFKSIGVLTPKVFNLKTFEDIVNASKELPWDEEGYVVHDKYNNRMKIKSPAYVMAHYSRMNGNISKKHLIKVVLENQEEEFLTYCSDYSEALNSVRSKMQDYLINCDIYINQCPQTEDRKEYAAFVNTLDEIYRPYLFSCLKEYKTPEMFTQDWSESKWEKVISTMNVG